MYNHVNTLKIENYSWGMKIAEMANRSLHVRVLCRCQIHAWSFQSLIIDNHNNKNTYWQEEIVNY